MLMINGAFRGIASGASAGGGGSSTDLLTLNAALSGTAGYKYWNISANYAGSAIFSNGDAQGDRATGYPLFQKLALGNSTGKIFTTGLLEDSWAEYTIPALSTSTNVNDLNICTLEQSHKFCDPPAKPVANFRVFGGGIVNGNFISSINDFYGSAGTSLQNIMRYSNSANLSTSTQYGSFQMTGAATNFGDVIPIPSEYQAANKLNGTHCVVGGGASMGIDARKNMGISVWAFTDTALTSETANDAAVTAHALADFPFAGDVAMGGFTQAQYSSGAVGTAPEIWNHISHSGGAFFVPGTRTLMVTGHNWTGQTEILYHGTALQGHLYAGYGPYDATDCDNWYWLYDVDDLIAVSQGLVAASSIAPYEHGAFYNSPFDNAFFEGDSIPTSLITGGMWDPTANIFYLNSRRGAAGRFAGSPTFFGITLALV